MLELELKWFIVQLINFLFLIVFLNIVLFKPLLALFKKREENTTGALEMAKKLGKEKDDVIARIEGKMADGRIKAKKIFEEQAKEGTEAQRVSLESAQNDAIEINRKAKEELNTATEKARAELKSNIESFSKQIVDKLVGA